MADRDRVTITLGRGGQVVKRSGPVSNVSHTDYLPSAGSKRSIRDRLGSNGSQLNNKRQRGAGDRSYLTANGVEDIRIGKDDLRFKLMQKNLSRGNDNERVTDLRDKLSRTAQPHRGSLDVRQRMPDPKDSSVLRRIPSSRSLDDLSQMDSMRSSYSGWTSDRIRRRSPDGMLSSSRGLSPRRNVEELQRRPLNRTYDVVRSVPFMSKDAPEISRSMNSAPFIAKPTLHTGSAKPMGPLLGQLPPPSGGVQKSSYLVDEHQTVDGLLGALGLGKYAILFKAEEVDMTALKQMSENDLKELGIPMGPRKKILLALAPRTKRQQG